VSIKADRSDIVPERQSEAVSRLGDGDVDIQRIEFDGARPAPALEVGLAAKLLANKATPAPDSRDAG
jgi:hypothetical protein